VARRERASRPGVLRRVHPQQASLGRSEASAARAHPARWHQREIVAPARRSKRRLREIEV
jgi:hypothetical protein